MACALLYKVQSILCHTFSSINTRNWFIFTHAVHSWIRNTFIFTICTVLCIFSRLHCCCSLCSCLYPFTILNFSVNIFIHNAFNCGISRISYCVVAMTELNIISCGGCLMKLMLFWSETNNPKVQLSWSSKYVRYKGIVTIPPHPNIWYWSINNTLMNAKVCNNRGPAR